MAYLNCDNTGWVCEEHRLDSPGAAPIFAAMLVTRELRRRSQDDRSLRSFEPCLPRPAKQPPSGPGWIHEIKHDGFRILAHSDARSVRLLTRNGYDFAERFPLAVAAIAALPARSCVIEQHVRQLRDIGPDPPPLCIASAEAAKHALARTPGASSARLICN